MKLADLSAGPDWVVYVGFIIFAVLSVVLISGHGSWLISGYNTASKEELLTLNGIGDVRAQAILKYREEHGEFRSIEELMEVEGIKKGTFQKLKDQIKIWQGRLAMSRKVLVVDDEKLIVKGIRFSL